MEVLGMKICNAKDIKVAAGTMAAVLLLGGCSVITENNVTSDPDVKTEIDLEDVDKTTYDSEVMDELYRKYCFDIFSQTIRDYGSDSNVMISPASIMMALDMVSAGAKNESLKQLTDLFAAGQEPLSQQAYAAALMDKINGAKGVEFSCANAVWSNKTILGDKVNLDYIEYIQDTFSAEYNLSKFSGKTTGEINKWVDEHTDHMIEKVIENLDSDTVMVLVNAIAFDAKWSEPYEEYQVREADFTRFDGSTQKADFLYGTENTYYETDKATGFIKYYKGGQYAFLTILPADESVSANEFAKSFSAEDYEKFIRSAAYDYEVITEMPVFESEFNCMMNDTLINLGVKDVFDPGSADLSGISGNPGDIYVSKVIHKTFIRVDANGTKAAAVTAVTLDAGCAMPEEKEYRYVECDRPFVYAIVDVETMAPVFIGTVNEV